MSFKKRESELKKNLAILGNEQEKQSNQLKLYKALEKQLQQSNQILNKTIYDMNTDLFSILFDKNTH